MIVYRKMTDDEVLKAAEAIPIRFDENIYVYKFSARTEIKASRMCADLGASWCGKIIGNKIQHILPIEKSRGR